MRNPRESKTKFPDLETKTIRDMVEGVQLTGLHSFNPILTLRASNQFLGDGHIAIRTAGGVLVVVFDVSLGREQGTPVIDGQGQPINEEQILSDLIVATNSLVDEAPDNSRPHTLIASLCETFNPPYLSTRAAALDWGYSVAAALVPPLGNIQNIQIASVGTNFAAFGNVVHNPMFPVLLQPDQLFFTPSRLDGRKNPSIKESDVLPRNSVVLATDGIAREINPLHFGLANRGVNLKKMPLTPDSQEGLYVVITKAY